MLRMHTCASVEAMPSACAEDGSIDVYVDRAAARAREEVEIATHDDILNELLVAPRTLITEDGGENSGLAAIAGQVLSVVGEDARNDVDSIVAMLGIGEDECEDCKPCLLASASEAMLCRCQLTDTHTHT